MASQQWQCDENQTLTQQYENVENMTVCDDSRQQQSSSVATNDDQNVNTRSDIEIIRSQPNSSLYLAKTFEVLNIPENLLKGLYEMGFSAPTKIQEMALPLLLATPPTDLIVQSHYRTGKTVAFVLASLCRIDTQLNYPQVMIVLPTNESVIQTGEVVRRMAKYVPEIKFHFAIRGENISRGSHVVEHFIICTPRELIDLEIKRNLFDRNLIKVLVGNEADIYKDIDTVGYSLQIFHIRRTLSPDCQMIYISESYNLISRYSVNIRQKHDEEILDNINQYYVVCQTEEHYKFKALFNIFSTISMGQAFVFCHNERSAYYLRDHLKLYEHLSYEYIYHIYYGYKDIDIDMAKRVKRFIDEQKRLLIINNVGAICLRDIDVGFVVNYDLPINWLTKELDKDMYFRRISRTGRFGNKGVVINFVDSEKTILMVKELEKHFGRKISELDAKDKSEIEKINRI